MPARDVGFQQFIAFTEEFRKVYYSGKERRQRARIFYSNLKRLGNLNFADRFSPYGITKFFDMLETQFAKAHLMFGVAVSSTLEQGRRHVRSLTDSMDWTGPIPKCFDWRDRSPPVVTKVKDQGKCASCWAFAAVAQIESVWAIQGHEPLTELSTQQVVSCDSASYGCNGGWPVRAMNYVTQTGGIQTESSYPYVSGLDDQTRNCTPNSTVFHASVTGWLQVTKRNPTADDEYDMMVYLYRRGPITVCLNAGNLQFYSHAILSYCGGNHRDTTHCVVLTGFGVSRAGIPYWIARNSWGEDWGNGGYFLIERNVNMCGIAEHAHATFI